MGRDTHIPVLQGHRSQKGRPTNRKKCRDKRISGSHVCAENTAGIREGLGPGRVTANEGVSGHLRGGDF